MIQEKCPRCDSPAPKLHPAMQFEGEVSPCSHEYHGEGFKKLDTLNRQSVGLQGTEVVILLPRNRMTADEAMMFAAYLITMAQMADSKLPSFVEYVRAVQSA